MGARLVLPPALRDALVAHARAGLPNEACGVISGTAPAFEGGLPTRWHPARNRFDSPLRFEVHPDDLLLTVLAVEDAGECIWGIVHSHVRSPARPSPTDIARAWPGVAHLIVSLDPAEADPSTGAPSVRAWNIDDGTAIEVEVLTA